MPKKVDHELRRAELAEALYRVAARAGMKGVTVRSVSSEAGWSRDAVNHYFAGKDELILYACRRACERTLERVRACRAQLTGGAALRAVLLEALVLENAGEAAAGAWLELLGAAARDARLGELFGGFDRELRSELAAAVAEMIALGEAPPESDPQAEAGELFAFNLGLQTRARLEPGWAARASREREVNAHLARIGRTAIAG